MVGAALHISTHGMMAQIQAPRAPHYYKGRTRPHLLSRLQWSAPPSTLSTRSVRLDRSGALSCAVNWLPLLIQF